MDDLCESFDEWEAPGDTPIRFFLDEEFFTIAGIHKSHDGTIMIELQLEEA